MIVDLNFYKTLHVFHQIRSSIKLDIFERQNVFIAFMSYPLSLTTSTIVACLHQFCHLLHHGVVAVVANTRGYLHPVTLGVAFADQVNLETDQAFHIIYPHFNITEVQLSSATTVSMSVSTG